MNTEQQATPPKARSIFRVLAGMLAMLALFFVCVTVNFALESSRPIDVSRWIVSAALFLFMGIGFAYAAWTGYWIRWR